MNLIVKQFIFGYLVLTLGIEHLRLRIYILITTESEKKTEIETQNIEHLGFRLTRHEHELLL